MSALMQRAISLLMLLAALVPLYFKYTALAAPADSSTWVSSKNASAAADAAAAAAAEEEEELSGWMSFMTQSPHLFMLSLWSSSVVVRALFIVTLALNARRIFDATSLARGPSLTHWAGAILAHRGYRSEAQQKGQLCSAMPSRMATPRVGTPRSISRRASRAGTTPVAGATPPILSRRLSRDDSAVNPLMAAAAATLFEKTFGAPASPAHSPTSTGAATPTTTSAASSVGVPSLSDSNLLASRRRSTSGAGLGFGLPPLAPSASTAASTFGMSPRPQSAPTDSNNYNIPENSMLAFIYAHEAGVHGVEVDVAMTKDNEIIVMHDNTLERTMEGSGEVPHHTLAEIQAMKYRRVTNHEYVIQDPRNRKIDIARVPTLEQVIIFCRDRKLKLMIETKEYIDHHLLRSKIVALYDKYDMYSWSFVATFNPWHLYHYRKNHPLIPTCLLYCRTCTEWCHQDASKEMLLPSWLNYEPVRRTADWLLWYFSPTLIADWLGVSMVGPHNILISPALITSLTTRGIVCDVWVVNAELEKQWLKSLGCIVTSDRLFSFADVSPFPETEPPPSRALGLTPPPYDRAPSIHSAAEHVNASYYIHNPEAVVVADPSDDDGESDGASDEGHSGAEEDTTELQPAPRKMRNGSSGREEAAGGAHGSDASGDDDIGTGEVSLAHLRSGSDGGPDSSFARTPSMSPRALALAEDRITETDMMPVVLEEEAETKTNEGISQRHVNNDAAAQ